MKELSKEEAEREHAEQHLKSLKPSEEVVQLLWPITSLIKSKGGQRDVFLDILAYLCPISLVSFTLSFGVQGKPTDVFPTNLEMVKEMS